MKKNTNPYQISYIALTMVCCLILSILFLFINYQEARYQQEIYTKERLELITEDLEEQLSQLRKLCLQIGTNKIYQPFYFRANKYYEISLLDNFSQYINYSPLLAEYFLMYMDNTDCLFHSSGHTMWTEIYLQNLQKKDGETLMNTLKQAISGEQVLTMENTLFAVMPIKLMRSEEPVVDAVICFCIPYEYLEERFVMIGGKLEGKLSLYLNGELLFGEEEYLLSQKEDVLTAGRLSGVRICYLPADGDYLVFHMLPLQILLVLSIMLSLLGIASLFAERAYKPLKFIAAKYREKIPLSGELQCRNELEEINYMMDTVLKSNLLANVQIEQKQKLLRGQLLHMLLEGSYSFDIHPYLQQLQLPLPGPCFSVLSISFSDEAVGKDFLDTLEAEINHMAEPGEQQYVYVLCNYVQRQLAVILSIPAEADWEELTEDIKEVAESFEYKPVVGCGYIYREPGKISASYLESLDDMKRKTVCGDKERDNRQNMYDQLQAEKLWTALSLGLEEEAGEVLLSYLEQLQRCAPSLLMQKYIFTDFLSGITRVARENRLEIPKQGISLILSAKTAEEFGCIAKRMVHDLCAEIKKKKEKQLQEASRQVYEYVNQHFTEYDLSLEKTAGDLGTSTSFVRQAIKEHTGKMYKDYLIWLRIEYAKELLSGERVTIAEVCNKVGYGNISYFIKVFKEMTGVTPARYRKEDALR